MFHGDALYLTCRDARHTKGVELALRAFSLATSHELREPCNTILVSLAVLERCAGVAAAEAATAEQAGSAAGTPDSPFGVRALIGTLFSSARLLQGIVGNVITALQVEAGELQLRSVVFR